MWIKNVKFGILISGNYIWCCFIPHVRKHKTKNTVSFYTERRRRKYSHNNNNMFVTKTYKIVTKHRLSMSNMSHGMSKARQKKSFTFKFQKCCYIFHIIFVTRKNSKFYIMFTHINIPCCRTLCVQSKSIITFNWLSIYP